MKKRCLAWTVYACSSQDLTRFLLIKIGEYAPVTYSKSESRFHRPFNHTTKIRQSISKDQIIKREKNKNSHLSHINLYGHIKQLSKTLR